MVQTGAPDFQSFTNWSDDQIVSQLVSTVNGIKTVGTFNVSQWLGLSVLAFTFVGFDCELVFTYFADAALAVEVSERRYTITNFAVPLQVTVPNAGLFVTISIVALVAGANAISLNVSPTNRIGPSAPTTDLVGLVESTVTAVGAGATVTIHSARTFTGITHLSVVSALAACVVKLQTVDLAGAAHPFFEAHGPFTNGFAYFSGVCIPPGHVQFTFQNTTGAAGTFSAYLMPDQWRFNS